MNVKKVALQVVFMLSLFSIGAIAPVGAVAEDSEEASWDVNAIPGVPREVNIDTRSGSWMSLDVSPDGQTIAFDMLGDIYVLPIAGGRAKSINSGLSWAMQPRFSPDGSQIAFTSDAGGGDNVWIMNSDGSDARQLTKEDFRLLNNAAWSPDGRYLAARKHFTTTRSLGTGEIWMYHRNGGSGVAVVERPNESHQKELGEPIFSPDGRYIYYTVNSTPGSTFEYAQDSNGSVFEIRRKDLETGEDASFITGAGGAVRATPSPDGKSIAFVRRIRGKSALFVKDLTSGAETPIFTELDQDLQEVWAVHGVYPNMDWMPDSASIVFWTGGGFKRINVASKSVDDIQFHVVDTRTVYDAPRPKVDVAPTTFATQMVRNAELSPDGTQIVFESAGRLYLKKLPDGEPRALTRNSEGRFEYDPSWSRDGRRITFVAWDDQELAHVHIVRARAGSGDSRLTRQPGHFHAPRFSPDGKSIVFDATSGGFLTSPDWSMQTGVFIVSSDGGDAQLITDSGSNPHFGARRDRLYVTRLGDGGRELVSIDLNGENPRTHAVGEHLVRYEVAPNDQHFTFRQNYNIYALPLPPGGNALQLSTSVASVSMTKASSDGGNYPHWSSSGDRLAWTLGATLYSTDTADLFAIVTEDDASYEAPLSGVSLSMRLDADVPSSKLAFVGARIVTMADNDGGIIDNGVIVVEGNRITAVGDDVQIPADAERVDVAGKTIIPGLIDAHAHGSAGVGMIPEQNWIAYATLAFGVTTIHDPSNDATEIFAAAEMQRTGQILAPRIFSTGDIVYGARSSYLAEIDSLEDAQQHVRRLKAQGAVSIKNYNQPRRDQRQQVTTAAREQRMLVVSEGGSLFHMDLSMVADGNSAIEHNLPQSMLYDDVLQFWGQTNVAYTPTLTVTYGGLSSEHYWYKESDVWKHPILSNFVPPHILQPRSVRRITAPDDDFYHFTSARTAKQLADQGVMVSIGAHGQREGLASHWEMWSFAQGGMSSIEALRTATTTPAKALGYDSDIGSLEVGKLADLVIINANVVEDIFASDKVDKVMLNGRLYDAATLNEEVTGNRKTEPFYWQK